MCNAWNHPPGCNCGWGGEYHGGGGLGGSLVARITGTSNTSASPSSQRAIGKQPQEISEARTNLTTCWWCGAQVYYHSNGYGDSVLFDELGAPWQVHSCWRDYWNDQKSLRKGLVGNVFKNETSQRIQRIETYENSGRPSIYRTLLGQPSTRVTILQRMAVLAGVVRQSQIMPIEAVLAQRLGITIAQLRQIYGDLYEIDIETNEVYLKPVSSVQFLSNPSLTAQRVKATERPSSQKSRPTKKVKKVRPAYKKRPPQILELRKKRQTPKPKKKNGDK